MKRLSGFLILAGLLLLFSFPVRAEEGIWPLENLPSKALGFKPSTEWLDHVRMSTVRLNYKNTGAFVSSRGLIVTSRSAVTDDLGRISSPEKDYANEGFCARTPQEEIPVPGMEIEVLVSMQNVTDRVRKALGKVRTKDQVKAKREIFSRIVREVGDKTLRGEVVDLYFGGQYWLYRYRRYVDVRLVMAPDSQSAFFGGAGQMCTYPRYCLDYAFFRAWQRGKPAVIKHYFRMNLNGAREKEPVFIAGHPYGMSRILPASELRMYRDILIPRYTADLKASIGLLERYSKKGQEQQRRAHAYLFNLRSTLRSLEGIEMGLKGPGMARFEKMEESFRRRVARHAVLGKQVNEAYAVIDRVERSFVKNFDRLTYRTLESGNVGDYAQALVLYAREIRKPDAERLSGYRDNEIDELKEWITAPYPCFNDLEELLLAQDLARSLEHMGRGEPYVKAVLAGKSPDVRARELASGTRLNDPKVRENLLKGGHEAILKSKDPLIQAALKAEPFIRDTMKWYEENVSRKATPAFETIARVRYQLSGTEHYPEATSSLRLSWGKAAGYPAGGSDIPYTTTFYGLFERSAVFSGSEAWRLPRVFVDHGKELNLAMPLNFICTADIMDGNMGSPAFNRNLEMVGVVFDRNMESLAGSFLYPGGSQRVLAVQSAGILESLRALYGAQSLLDELLK